MDIVTTRDGFIANAFRGFEVERTGDGALLVWSARDPVVVNVMTSMGQFVEVTDADGKVMASGGDGNFMRVQIGEGKVRLCHKRLPDPDLTGDQINAARRVVTRYLVDNDTFDLQLPESLSGVIGWLSQKLESIPAECKDSAEFRFDAVTEYGEAYPHMEITYRQAETDAEVVARVKIEAERSRMLDAAERQRFERLKEKFES